MLKDDPANVGVCIVQTGNRNFIRSGELIYRKGSTKRYLNFIWQAARHGAKTDPGFFNNNNRLHTKNRFFPTKGYPVFIQGPNSNW